MNWLRIGFRDYCSKNHNEIFFSSITGTFLSWIMNIFPRKTVNCRFESDWIIQDFEGTFIINLELVSIARFYAELSWKLPNLKMTVLTCPSKPLGYHISFIYSYKFWQYKVAELYVVVTDGIIMLHPDAHLLCHFSVAILLYATQIRQKNSTGLCGLVSYTFISTHFFWSVDK